MKKYLDNLRWRGFITRQIVVRAVRDFFDSHGLIEAQVPILARAPMLEPNIGVFSTYWQSSQKQLQLFLATSPEQNFKKLIAQGLGESYAIGHSFRNLEASGDQHQPEFLMLEWYRFNQSLEFLLRETQNLFVFCHNALSTVEKRSPSNEFTYQGQSFAVDKPWSQILLPDLFTQYCDLDLAEVLDNHELLFQFAEKQQYQLDRREFEPVFNQVFLNEIETKLPQEPFFLIDFPAVLSPMAKAQQHKPLFAQRFELYIAGLEIANGCVEETDEKKLEQVFAEQLTKLQVAGQNINYDTDFLQAVKLNANNNLAGVGLGIDRLAMILAGEINVNKVSPKFF